MFEIRLDEFFCHILCDLNCLRYSSTLSNQTLDIDTPLFV